ncbi:hypothetical protein [Microbacterium sp. IEGM 1404]|uniref:hypothetical protein n=1 Tax=Microbacterium sp. IEGM 1404 TaxID=3047084 RepID=UPI0024B85A79|nr:hypothetical protein [Microbacterium sp. IEGM 1404]MDI9889956.1 hypothetical protein [Microbacterium sp. IEGM 1404]
MTVVEIAAVDRDAVAAWLKAEVASSGSPRLVARRAHVARVSLVVDDTTVAMHEFTPFGVHEAETRWAGDMRRHLPRIVDAFLAACKRVEDE